MSGFPPGGIFGSLDPSNPQTAQLLGAIQGLGAAAAPSRLPVTAGMAFGSLAGGMMSGAEQGAKLRALNTQQQGDAIKAQNDLYQLNLREYGYGQPMSSPADLAANRFRQLQMNIPNPGGLPEGQAPGSIAPVAPTATAPGLSAPAAMTKKYEADGLAAKAGIDPYYIGTGGKDLSNAPLDPTGFPIWDGKDGSRAAGAFQFEPQTWAKYAPIAGVKDFSPASQIKVFNAAYAAEGWAPWTPYNPQLARAVGAEAPHGSLAGEPLPHGWSVAGNSMANNPAGAGANQYDEAVARGAAAGQEPPLYGGDVPATMAPLTSVNEPPGGATGAPPGAPMPIGGSPMPPGFGGMLQDPTTRQMLASQAAFPGSIPAPAYEIQMARFLPPGPMQQSAVLSAMKNMGIPLVKGGDRPNAPMMQVNPDTFLRTGEVSYDVKVPSGYMGQVEARAEAEARGRGAGELPYAGPIAGAKETAEQLAEAAVRFGAPYGGGGVPSPPGAPSSAPLPIVPGRMGQAGVSPAAPGSPSPNVGLGAAPTMPPLGGTAAAESQQEVYKSLNNKLIDNDTTYLKDLEVQNTKAKDVLGQTKLIGDLADEVSTGWTGAARQHAAKIMTAVGVPDAAVKMFTGMDPTAGDALNKFFLQQTATAVRAMGAREPGSVISLFQNSFANFETQPGAIHLLENVISMQAKQYQDEFAQSQAHVTGARDAMARGVPYQPLGPFTAQFSNVNSPTGPRNYMAAAEAMSVDPKIPATHKFGPMAWQGARTQAAQDQIYELMPKGARFYAPDGRLLVKQ